MAEDLAKALPAAPAKPRAATRRRDALRGRFLVAYIVLGVLGGAAVAGAFVLITQTERDKNAGWADWHPVGEQATYGQQIADHVALRYRLTSGDQLAGIVPGPPEVQGPQSSVKVAAVLIESPGAASEPDIHALSTDDSYMYLLCGNGATCTVKGTATEERHRLLRREALELALYTFKYIDGVDTVIVLLPPPSGTEQSPNAVFLREDDVKAELQRPLAETIERPDAPKLTAVPELETIRVDRLTLPFVFEYRFDALPNSTAALFLSPVKSAG